mgnify:CR=1 FL=1
MKQLTEEEVIKNKNDKQFILKAVSENGKFLDLVSPELKNDKEVALATVKNSESRRYKSYLPYWA